VTRVLALDVGTSSVRARVYDERGTWNEHAEAQVPYPAVEHDPDVLVRAADAVLKETLAEAGGDVDAIACSCFWHSLLAVDEAGEPVSPLFTWADRRAAPQAERLARELGRDAVHARTGAYPHPSYWPAQLAWLAEEEPETFRRAARFLPFGSFLYARLAGGPACSISLASGTGLYDPNALDWDEELLDAVGVGPERLPEVSDEPRGEWFPPLGDGACSSVGCGALGRGRAALMVGTSGALRTVFEADGGAPRDGLFLYRLDSARVVEGGALSDGGNLYAWLESTLRLGDEALDSRPPDAHGLTFLPLLGGERAPGWRADARGAIDGLVLTTTPADIAQAALEGVAYRFAEIAERMPEVREVVATGGALVRNPGWAQVIADVLELPVALSAVEEASARGAAVATLERLGLTPDAPPTGEPLLPRPERRDAYRAARQRQRRLYDALA
jgi:gluconokinase